MARFTIREGRKFWKNPVKSAPHAFRTDCPSAGRFDHCSPSGMSRSAASRTEPATRRLPAFDVVTDHLYCCSDRNR
jgi:hypothetical protein